MYFNFVARRDESFAYDLDVRPGRVSIRVALLLRDAERKPVPARFVSIHTPPRSTCRVSCCDSYSLALPDSRYFQLVVYMPGRLV